MSGDESRVNSEWMVWRKHAAAVERAYQHWCKPQYDNERRRAANVAYLSELLGEEIAADQVRNLYHP